MFLCFSYFSFSDEIWATTFVLTLLIMFDAELYVSLRAGTADADTN